MGTDRLSREQIELVLRRAAEMDATREAGNRDGEARAGELTVTELVRLGREAGLRSDAVLRAVAELQRGALVPTEEEGGGFFGPRQLIVSREVPGPPDPTRRAVERFLRKQLMTVRRHHGDRIEWERARGLFPGLARSLDFARRYAFGPVTQVETLVVAETAESTSVTFKIDVSELRRGRAVSVAVRGLAAFAAIGVGGAALIPGFGVQDVLALLAGGAAAGGLTALERRRLDETRRRIALEPERFLDLLVQKRRRELGDSSPSEGAADVEDEAGEG